MPVGLHAFSASLMDWRLLVFAGALSIATGLLFGRGPALQSARASTADTLQQHARGNSGGRSRRFRALPGVRAVAFGSALPFRSTGFTRGFTIEGRPRQPGDDSDVVFRVGTSDYLQTLRVTLLQGRLLDARDSAEAPRAIVVNETFVRRHMPGQSALGRQLRFAPNEPPFTIVGVVKDVLERGFQAEPKAGVYVTAAYGPRFFPTVNLMVRVGDDPLGYAPAVQRIIRSVDPDRPSAWSDR